MQEFTQNELELIKRGFKVYGHNEKGVRLWGVSSEALVPANFWIKLFNHPELKTP